MHTELTDLKALNTIDYTTPFGPRQLSISLLWTNADPLMFVYLHSCSPDRNIQSADQRVRRFTTMAFCWPHRNTSLLRVHRVTLMMLRRNCCFEFCWCWIAYTLGKLGFLAINGAELSYSLWSVWHSSLVPFSNPRFELGVSLVPQKDSLSSKQRGIMMYG